jgi:hypothetical protein
MNHHSNVLIICCLVILSALLWNVWKSKETFDNAISPLTIDAESLIARTDDMRCGHLMKNPGEGQQVDLINNYRMFKIQTKPNKCYMKMSDTLVDNSCTRLNERLYEDNFNDVIDDIRPLEETDPYIAKTLKDKMCTFTFKDSNYLRKMQYATFLDNNDPKVAQKTREKNAQAAVNADMLNVVNGLVSSNNDKRNTVTTLETQLNTLNQDKSNKLADSQSLSVEIDGTTKLLQGFNMSPIDIHRKTGVLGLQSGHAQCQMRETGQKQAGRYSINYMDRLDVKCNPNEYIGSMYLDTRGDKANYRYQCCPINSNVRSTVQTKSTEWQESGQNWDAIFLDRHNIDCEKDGLIQQFRLETKPKDRNKIRFNYTCLKPQFSKDSTPQTVCTETQTYWRPEKRTFDHLENHNPSCPEGQSISQLKIERGNNQQARYKYRCCSTIFNK